jgi:hypothetical protein
MNNVLEAFATSDIQDVFSDNALSILSAFKFWLYGIFYIAVVLTGIFTAFAVYGYTRDRKEILESYEEELRDFEEIRQKELGATDVKEHGNLMESPEAFRDMDGNS